ncbi:MAG: carboxypeptidase regulatory-like domain-containing protein [Nitrospira sp.]|nr:carboxypeptidase regulatory-like domain-containing protein [Nitrospira sp.]
MNPRAEGRLFLSACLVVGLVVSEATAGAYQGDPTIEGVTVQGRVKLSGLPKNNAPIPVYRDGDYCGETILGEAVTVDPSTKGFDNAVVSLVGVERGKPLIPGESPLILEIESKKCRFSPHVSAVAVGTILEVRNLDPILHNLHVRRDTRFGPTVMNFIQPAGTRSVQKPFSETGFLDVRCDVHAFMSAFVHVFDHPYFARTDTTGSFVMTKVPPGLYKLRIWHEQFGTQERTVTVPSGENVTLEMEIGGNNLAPSNMGPAR